MEAGPVSGAVVGRFAPSPSGRLHLGNLACSLLAWLSAKSQGGRIVLRIEDLDAERCPRIYADLLEQDLAWLGLVWDEGGSTGGPHGPYYQSECADIYTGQYKKLEAQGLVYPCFCSRAQLHAASAPHTSDGNVIYPGTCRYLTAARSPKSAKRRPRPTGCGCRMRRSPFWTAAWALHTENLLRDCGDFKACAGRTAVRPSAGRGGTPMPAWGSPRWVRGSDRLSATPRQLYLYRLVEQGNNLAHTPMLQAMAGAAAVQVDTGNQRRRTCGKIHRRSDVSASGGGVPTALNRDTAPETLAYHGQGFPRAAAYHGVGRTMFRKVVVVLAIALAGNGGRAKGEVRLRPTALPIWNMPGGCRRECIPQDAPDQPAVRVSSPAGCPPAGRSPAVEQGIQYHRAGNGAGHKASMRCAHDPHAKPIDQHPRCRRCSHSSPDWAPQTGGSGVRPASGSPS